MQTEFVMAVCDVYVKWKQGDPPRYRCYVNDELFTERSWIWHDRYLEEHIPIQAVPGHYTIRYELVEPEYARIKVHNLRVITGPGTVNDKGCVHIHATQIAQ
jgi:hypothetical protein